MDQPSSTPEARFTTIVETMRDQPNVTYAADVIETTKRFGTNVLKINDKIFAMLVKGNLVVKLPRDRVDALIAAGAGQRFDPGHGRLMKEWVSLDPAVADDWLSLAKEAMRFVASKPG